MTREEEPKNPRLFDTRTLERNIRKGLITRKDYDKYLKSLVDATPKIAPADMLMDDDEDDLDAETRDAVEPVVTVTAVAHGAAAEGEGDDDEDDLDDIDDEDDDDDLDEADAEAETDRGEEPPKV